MRRGTNRVLLACTDASDGSPGCWRSNWAYRHGTHRELDDERKKLERSRRKLEQLTTFLRVSDKKCGPTGNVPFAALALVLSYAVLSSDIIELAHLTAGGQEFFPTLLGQLRAAFECDASAIHVAEAYPVTGGGPLATVGFDPDVRRACASRWPTYLQELAPLARLAAGAGCVASDRDAFQPSERSRKAYFREFVAPQGGSDTLVAYLCLRDRPVAALALALTSRPWSAEARRELAALIPALSIAVASARCVAPQWGVMTRLTPREQQVLSGIDAGLSNAEIAACCGTSVNTVRNQVASLLYKLEASSRGELAARGLSAFVERHV